MRDFFAECLLLGFSLKLVSWGKILGGKNAAGHGYKVRRKLDGYRFSSRDGKFLLDFGQVPVFWYAVGSRAFVAFGVKKR